MQSIVTVEEKISASVARGKACLLAPATHIQNVLQRLLVLVENDQGAGRQGTHQVVELAFDRGQVVENVGIDQPIALRRDQFEFRERIARTGRAPSELQVTEKQAGRKFLVNIFQIPDFPNRIPWLFR